MILQLKHLNLYTRTRRVLRLDIESFFDSIPHDRLKLQWQELMGVVELPPDHYAVYKAITRWAQVDRGAVYERLGISKRRQQKGFDGPLCTPLEFRTKIRGRDGLIVTNRSGKGIPQGSPMSALLSNVVMLQVDQSIGAAAAGSGLLYRRYSDDIIIAGERSAVARLEKELEKRLIDYGLTVNSSKRIEVDFQCGGHGKVIASKPLQYLGFTYDGERVLLRSQTLSRFFQRARRSVRAAARAAGAASRASGGVAKIRRQKLYGSYSHLPPLGRSAKTGRGNFYSYVTRAAKKTKSKAIMRQLRHHWGRLNDSIVECEKDLAGD